MEQPNQPPYTLQPVPQEELDAFNEELKSLLEKYTLLLMARPQITQEGATVAKILVYKKIPLPEELKESPLPQSDGIESGEGNKNTQDN